MPVLNEERHLRAAVRSILDQDYPGDIEVVLALGPSRTDQPGRRGPRQPTPRVTHGAQPDRAHPERRSTSRSRRASTRSSRASTATRCSRPTTSRERSSCSSETGADNVGGLMSARGVTDFEQAVAHAMTSKLGVGNAPFHVGGDEGPADTVYLGVFRRTALERVGGYDEDFVRAQDWEMNYRIRDERRAWCGSRRSCPCPTARAARCRALAQQYFHYGRWRRQVMRAHPGSINLRYLAPPTALLGVVAGLVFQRFCRSVGVDPSGRLSRAGARRALSRSGAVLPLRAAADRCRSCL